MSLVIKCLPFLLIWWGVALFSGIILEQARLLSHNYCQMIIFTYIMDRRGSIQEDCYINGRDSAQEILGMFDKTVMEKLLLGGDFARSEIAMELCPWSSDIAEKAIIDGSICIPQPRLANLASCWYLYLLSLLIVKILL